MNAAHRKFGSGSEWTADAMSDLANMTNGNPPVTSDQWKIGLSGDWATPSNWTNGVPTSSSDVTIGAFGTYTVTLSTAGAADSVTFDAAGATFSESASGSLDIVGDFEIDAGTAILNGNNTIGNDFRVIGGTLILNGANIVAGATSVTGGELEVGNSGALGVKTLGLQDGILLGTVTETLANHLQFFLSDTIAAAHGTVLTLSEGSWFFNGNQLTFGLQGDDGTVVWDSNSNASTGGSFPISIQDGTLKGGDDNFDLLFQFASSTTVAGGATLNLAGASVGILDLAGSGKITSTVGAPTLTLTTNFPTDLPQDNQETVSNTLSGSLSVDLVNNASGITTYVFTGNSNYTGTTTVESRVELDVGGSQLDGGGTTGTLGKDTVDLNGGSLFFFRSDTVTVANTIIGTGSVVYEGGGTYIVNHTNTYGGGTTITASTVYETDNAGSIGSGLLSIFDGGEFVATHSLSIVNGLLVAETPTIAAAHDKTLTLSLSNNWRVETGSTHVEIGDGTNDGTVLWKGGSGGTFDDNTATLEIRSGTFKDGDGTLSNFVSNFQSVTLDAGADLVLTTTGFIAGLSGTGTLTGSSGVEFGLGGGDFGGVFRGGVDLHIDAATVLTGDSTGVSQVTIANPGDALALGDGGTIGSVGSAPIEVGTFDSLIIDHSNAFSLSNVLSGSSSSVLEQLGTGTTTATHLTSFNGILDVVAGELVVNSTANNVRGVDLEGGTLATGKGVVFSHTLSVTGDVTLAAATKTALTLDFSSWSFDAHSLTFGDDTHTGKIVWHTPTSGTGVASDDQFTVDVHAGTMLDLADGNAGELLFVAQSTTIDTGATLNVESFGTAIGNLLGSGVIVGTGGAILEIGSGDFSGEIKGAISAVRVDGDFEIGGSNTFTGEYELTSSGATLTLDHAAKQDIGFFSADGTIAFTLGNTYSGTVSNFDVAIDPTLDFQGISFATATEHFANGVLTIGDGTNSEHVHLAGTFVDASFALADDHHGGVAVTFTGITDILGLS